MLNLVSTRVSTLSCFPLVQAKGRTLRINKGTNIATPSVAVWTNRGRRAEARRYPPQIRARQVEKHCRDKCNLIRTLSKTEHCFRVFYLLIRISRSKFGKGEKNKRRQKNS
ncbi:hypothetical protein PoB_005110400 [Plakobranchus ocellatus]|uniref:Secreted protein n=1 Tax=Plakobranchus ocellatus TaxID=259542 RepID=A0AAV4C1P7_9GAST|nr:hypothetical protein PoB_005110400 [Plakobranchus ocellatus]